MERNPVCREPSPVLRERLFRPGQASLRRPPTSNPPASERWRKLPKANRIATDLPLKVFLPHEHFGPISPLAPGLSETEAMTTLAPNETQLVDRIEEVGTKIQKVRETTASVIFGQDRVIDLALITVLSGGHALLIGVPGLAKTSLVETLGTVLGLENKRIQFTPDLMPSDIVG